MGNCEIGDFQFQVFNFAFSVKYGKLGTWLIPIRIPSFLIFSGKVGNLEIGFAKGGRGEGSAAVRAMGQRGWARMCLGPAGAKIENLGNSKILIPVPLECWNWGYLGNR